MLELLKKSSTVIVIGALLGSLFDIQWSGEIHMLGLGNAGSVGGTVIGAIIGILAAGVLAFPLLRATSGVLGAFSALLYFAGMDGAGYAIAFMPELFLVLFICLWNADRLIPRFGDKLGQHSP